MSTIQLTRDLFLWCMTAIYLFAFSSLYVQIPGLYSDYGVLPASRVLGENAESVEDLVSGQPTLLRLFPRLGLDTTNGLDFICLCGIVVSFVGMISRTYRNAFIFGLLWLLYLSLFQVGQTFLWFQWDILLLEVGFLCILVSPLSIIRWQGVWYHQHDRITLWLVRWLLFRLMFASGIVKLTSGCPTWWNLTALNYHYETQCLPTPLAWYAHQLPSWFQQLSVVITYVIEIPLPFLFFSPIRSQRLFSFYAQVFLQVLIIITGNYNFFNLLALVLCISLLDDSFIKLKMGKRSDYTRRSCKCSIRWFLNFLVFGFLAVSTIVLFGLRFSSQHFMTSKINFTRSEFDAFLRISLPVSMAVGLVSLGWEILSSFFRAVTTEKGILRKLVNIFGSVSMATIALMIFSVSLVDLCVVDHQVQTNLWPILHKMHATTSKFSMTNSYGLFRTMTGVGGRPEVVIEGSNAVTGPFLEYQFQYKPGNVSHAPRFVAPHQPRLDWQMWFAALGSYQQNLWLVNLCYRLLLNQPQVLGLLARNPFPAAPPNYVRARLFHYHFTSRNSTSPRFSSTDWWTRTFVREYLPVISKDEPSLLKYLRDSGFLQATTPKNVSPNFLCCVVEKLRLWIGQPNGLLFTLTLLAAAISLSFLDPTVKFVDL